MYIYIYRKALSTLGAVHWFMCLHGCAVACVSCVAEHTFAQCRIFLEGTLSTSRKDILTVFRHCV